MMRLPAAAKMMVLPITMLWSIHTHADASIKFHAGTPVREVVSAPEFAGYGRLLFPADNRYWSGDSLGSLKLTWYSEIRPASTVAVVNRLRADVLAKRRVFFDIYTEQEKQADPRKRNTGLFFFRGTPGARFAVCNAGGGFMFVGAIHDSFPHALSLSERGINAFALIYRPGAETACEDLARAIRRSWRSIRKGIRSGAAPRGRGWRHGSAHMELRHSEKNTCHVPQRSSCNTPGFPNGGRAIHRPTPSAATSTASLRGR